MKKIKKLIRNILHKSRDQVEGSTTNDELIHLQKMVGLLKKGSTVVEVGSHRGRSAIAMAKVAKKNDSSRVYAVDPHLPFTGVNGREFGPLDQEYMYRAITEAGVGCYLFVVSLTSEGVSNAWGDEEVDLVFLDGDHSAEGVNKDVSIWASKLRKDGFLAFHDSNLEAVKSCVSKLVESGDWVEFEVVNSITALKRK
jgi:predicted O-methyltransferase YrrM